MNAFYQKLTDFGNLVNSVSQEKHLDIADYFELEHPAFPVVKNEDRVSPVIHFTAGCPVKVKREVEGLWKTVWHQKLRTAA